MTANNRCTTDTVAAIDLGSNSFHMIVARMEDSGTLSIIDRIRENVRLGGGLDKHGNIDENAQDRAFICLESFSQRIRDLPTSAVRIAGTNTLRVARNSGSFVSKSEQILNHPIEIIAGREEARLIYLGVAHGLATGEGKRLVVDIGGGSTELIIGKGMTPKRRESLYTGCVSASRRFFKKGKVTAKKMKAAELDAALILLPQAKDFKSRKWDEAIGCSGTIKAIANIVQAEGWSQDGISYKSLLKLRDAMIDTKHIEKLELKGLSDNRRPVIAGGLSVLLAIFKILKIESMQVSEQSMREGLLYDLVGRITHNDVRDATIESVSTRWGVDLEQASRITVTVGHLFDNACRQWSAEKKQMKALLKWASMLHEIGLQVSHNNYHKHGAYILKNADMQGFSRQEQALMAALVLCHRSKFRVEAFNDLMKPFVKTGKQMCILLRIAVLLHRGRSSNPAPDVAINLDNKDIQLQFPDKWLDDHSLTLADLIKEIEHLDNAGYKLSFE